MPNDASVPNRSRFAGCSRQHPRAIGSNRFSVHPILGEVVCALMLMRVLEAMRQAETAGIAVVAGGMAEANLAMTIALYLAKWAPVIILVLVMIVMLATAVTFQMRTSWLYGASAAERLDF